MDASCQLLAARYLRKQTRQISAQLDGVRKAEDPEFIHRARVASRRLRSALRVFQGGFPTKREKRWGKAIRRFTKDLGPSRDKDVQIAFVDRFLSQVHDPLVRPGIARLLLRLIQSRQSLQPSVVRAVNRFEASCVADDLLATVGRKQPRVGKRDMAVADEFVFRRAADQIERRLRRLTEYESSLASPGAVESHHAMRIAAKRLRYTIEIFQPAYAGVLNPFVNVIKQVQTLLGDLHDCDVWKEQLENFLREERERTIEYFGRVAPFGHLEAGIEFFRRDRKSRRDEVFDQIAGRWLDLKRDRFWERLVSTLESPAGASDEETGSSESIRPDKEDRPCAGKPDDKAVPQGPPSEPGSLQGNGKGLPAPGIQSGLRRSLP